jgi:hypothetical protein
VGPDEACADPDDTTPPYTANVLEPGVTPGSGQGNGILVEFGLGPDGTIPSGGNWQWTSGEYAGDEEDQDVYQGTLVVPGLGEYDVAARFRLEQWTTWTYADLDGNDLGSGGTNGYSPSQAARLTSSGAEMVLAPTSFAWAVPAGMAVADTLRLQNTGTGALHFEIFESESASALRDEVQRFDLPWITAAPISGSVEPGEVGESILTVDAASLEPGSYSGYLVIWSNDCDGNPTVIPLALEVGTTAVDPSSEVLPRITRLRGSHPNPFNPSTQIRFDLHTDASVALEVYDLRGRRIRTLVRGALVAGVHEVTWNGRDEHGATVGSGVYVCRLRAGDYEGFIKLALLK